MSEKSETESERDLDGIDVISEPDASSKRSSLRSGAGGVVDRNDSSPAPHQVSLLLVTRLLTFERIVFDSVGTDGIRVRIAHTFQCSKRIWN